MALSITMLDADCDRCRKRADLLHPFKLAETITYRRRVIRFPWLCPRCYLAEKEKWFVAWKGTK